MLGLLDLSAAFNCVDHDILVRRLQQSFGICGTTLEWLQSFLHGRNQQVCYNEQLSAVVELLFGVPYGSVLGPLLFLLYTAELFDIISSGVLDSSDTRTPTTHRCTSVLQPHPRRFQRNVSSPALNASMPGCVATG